MNFENEFRISGFKPSETDTSLTPDLRQHCYAQARTSPRGHGEFLSEMFDHAFYPKNSLENGLINDLNGEFLEHWSNLRSTWSKPDRSHSSLSSLYFFARDYVGPVRLLFTLDSLTNTPEDSTVHFLARDAYPEFIFATNLRKDKALQRLPAYNYVPASLRLVRQHKDPEKLELKDPETLELIKSYLKQFSFGNGEKHTLVDIGFTGEITEHLSRIFPQDQYDVRFLFNEADAKVIEKRPVMSNATGFMYDAHNMNSFGIFKGQLNQTFRRVMEDTFSGLSTSSTEVHKAGSKVLSNSTRYPRNYNTLRRELALRGLRDCYKIWRDPIQRDLKTVTSNDTRVKLISNFKQLILYFEDLLRSDQIFVPHEPTNFNPKFGSI